VVAEELGSSLRERRRRRPGPRAASSGSQLDRCEGAGRGRSVLAFCSVQQSNHCAREEFLYDRKAGPAGDLRPPAASLFGPAGSASACCGRDGPARRYRPPARQRPTAAGDREQRHLRHPRRAAGRPARPRRLDCLGPGRLRGIGPLDRGGPQVVEVPQEAVGFELLARWRAWGAVQPCHRRWSRSAKGVLNPHSGVVLSVVEVL
jgi:hypothetical protein